jgi:hypothetical protein
MGLKGRRSTISSIISTSAVSGGVSTGQIALHRVNGVRRFRLGRRAFHRRQPGVAFATRDRIL